VKNSFFQSLVRATFNVFASQVSARGLVIS